MDPSSFIKIGQTFCKGPSHSGVGGQNRSKCSKCKKLRPSGLENIGWGPVMAGLCPGCRAFPMAPETQKLELEWRGSGEKMGSHSPLREGGRPGVVWSPASPVDYLPHGHKADQTGDLRTEGMGIGRRG